MDEFQLYQFDQTPGAPQELEEEMSELGVMKTIYVPVHPKVRAIKQALGARVDDTVGMFDNPHHRAPDQMHHEFFDMYREWSRAALDIQQADFTYVYPSSGSSEAIRETIAYHANQERAEGREPQIHIFQGEYEGYTAYADTHDVNVVVHDRDNYAETLAKHLRPGDRFYISTPSGIDGNIWDGYEDFLQFLEEHHPKAKLMLDFAYLNTTRETPSIRTQSPVVNSIFVSLSKAFPGTYYNRIGGLMSKEAFPGLYGNMWFKNLDSLLLGTNLMHNSPLGEIPTWMGRVQDAVIAELSQKLGSDDITPADVTFVATQPMPENPTPIQQHLQRPGTDHVRYCLTPGIAKYFESNPT